MDHSRTFRESHDAWHTLNAGPRRARNLDVRSDILPPIDHTLLEGRIRSMFPGARRAEIRSVRLAGARDEYATDQWDEVAASVMAGEAKDITKKMKKIVMVVGGLVFAITVLIFLV